MVKKESDLYPYSVTDLSRKDALVIAPHPDDESLGCGGSIIKHVRAGSRVKVIFLTNGDKGDFEKRFGDEYVKIRQKSAQKAMEILGVKTYEFWGYPDRELYAAEREIRDRLRKVITAFLPSLVYVPSLLEAHPDHRSSFQIGWELRELSGITVVLYEVLMALYPNILVDITDEIIQKKRAIECYYTEVYYNDYVAKAEGLNRFRTATLAKSVKYSEGFVMIGKDFSCENLPYRFPLTAVSKDYR